MMLREDLHERFSYHNIIKTVTRSKALADLVTKKKLSPLEQEGEKKRKAQEDNELQFKQYTASSIANLSNRIAMLASISQRNTGLIQALYNDLGYYRGQRSTNVNRSSSTSSSRIPFRQRTIKGRLDAVNEEIQRLKKLEHAKHEAAKTTSSKIGGKKAAATGGVLNTILSTLGKAATDPWMYMALFGGKFGKALSLGRILAKGTSLLALPGVIGRTADRMSGGVGYKDPAMEKLGQTSDKYLGGIGSYVLAQQAIKGYGKFSPKGIGSDRIGRKTYADQNRALKRASQEQVKHYEEKGRLDDIKKGKTGTEKFRMSVKDARLYEEYKRSGSSRTYSKKLQALLKKEGMTPEQFETRMSRVEDRVQQHNAANKARTAQIAGRNQRFAARVAIRAKPMAADHLTQLRKWTKMNKMLGKFGKIGGPMIVGFIAMKSIEIGNYVSNYTHGLMSKEEYREKMSKAYGELAVTLGSAGMGALVAQIIGPEFPGLAAVAGATLGMGAGMLFDDSIAASMIGHALFSLLNEDSSGEIKKYSPAAIAAGTAGATGATGAAGSTGATGASAKPSIGMSSSGMQTVAATAAELKGVSESGDAMKAIAFFVGNGWSKDQAAGIVGNLLVESTTRLQTDIKGDGGKAYGIAQWHPDRQNEFKRVYGKPIQESSFVEQLAFIQYELTHTHKSAGEHLKVSRGPTEAATIVDKEYEISAGIHRQKRIDYANQLVDATYKDRAVLGKRSSAEFTTSPLASFGLAQPSATSQVVRPPNLPAGSKSVVIHTAEDRQEDKDAAEKSDADDGRIEDAQVKSTAAIMALGKTQNQLAAVSKKVIELDRLRENPMPHVTPQESSFKDSAYA
jgi:hypothetical protein